MSEISSSEEHNFNQILTNEFISAVKEIEITDEVLTLIGNANNEISKILRPYIDNIILDKTGFFQDARDTAFLHFRSFYESDVLNLLEKSKLSYDRYKDSKKTLIESIKAQPSEAKRSVKASASVSVSSNLLNNIQGVTDERGNFFDN